jgi:hypothetical protein
MAEMKLQPWQEKLWADIGTRGLKLGEMMIMTAGRNVGKSMLSSQAAIDRLMRDLNSQPISDLVLGEARLHGARYYTVEPVGGNWPEMETWATKTFGPPGSIWDIEGYAHRWFMNDRRFGFRKERDRTLFVLRWSSQ